MAVVVVLSVLFDSVVVGAVENVVVGEAVGHPSSEQDRELHSASPA